MSRNLCDAGVWFALLGVLLLPGCSFLEASGEAVGVVGKVGWTAAKAVGGAVYTGTSMAGQTANQANRTMTRPAGAADDKARSRLLDKRSVVPLIKEGKSYFVRVKLNDKVWAKFLVDTGASAMQISQAMARRLKIKISEGQNIPVTLAGGGVVTGRMVVLKSVQLGAGVVENVRAIVLDQDNMELRDGLLGMSFLENFVFQIDTQKGELILERRS